MTFSHEHMSKQRLLNQQNEPGMADENSVYFHIHIDDESYDVCLFKERICISLFDALYRKLDLQDNETIVCTVDRNNYILSQLDKLDKIHDGDTLTVQRRPKHVLVLSQNERHY